MTRRLNQAAVAVLSDEFWRSRLAADPSIIGKTLNIDGDPTTIVGIVPRDFHIAHSFSVLRADVWSPIRFTPIQLTRRRDNFLLVLGRLTPDATPLTPQAELRTIFGGIAAEFPELRSEDLRVAPLQAENVAAVRTPLLLLFGAVGMVLLITATNVASRLLAWGVQRRRELAVRSALGATRSSVMRPALAESLLMTGVGVVFGLGIAIARGGVMQAQAGQGYLSHGARELAHALCPLGKRHGGPASVDDFLRDCAVWDLAPFGTSRRFRPRRSPPTPRGRTGSGAQSVNFPRSPGELYENWRLREEGFFGSTLIGGVEPQTVTARDSSPSVMAPLNP